MDKFLMILKMSANLIPALALGGSIAGSVYYSVRSENMKNEIYNELRQEEALQELVEKEKQNSRDQYDEGELSYKDYHDYLNYLDSEEFLKEFASASEEINGKYNDKFAEADKMENASNWMFLPTAISAFASVAWYAPLSEGKPLIATLWKEEYENYKKLKQYKKLEKEYEEYKEDLK